jgi:hypothetical protein
MLGCLVEEGSFSLFFVFDVFLVSDRYNSLTVRFGLLVTLLLNCVLAVFGASFAAKVV